MAKGQKSSATSGTRKKHEKRAQGPAPQQTDEMLPKEKKMKKKELKASKKEPRQKIYIPPQKPRPAQPDPLDATGLAHTLPPDLLVVLRSFSKKAAVTKIKALEDLQSGWIERALQEGEDGALVYTLLDMLPVWLHHLPPLLVHPSRRVRYLTASLQILFLRMPAVRDQVLLHIRETASPTQLEHLLGTWCMAAHDVDRSVATLALRSWTQTVAGTEEHPVDSYVLQPLQAFLQRVMLDPESLYLELNPPPPAPPPPLPIPQRRGQGRQQPPPPVKRDEDGGGRSKGEEMEESETDRRARLRIGGLGALRWLIDLGYVSDTPAFTLFRNPAFWTALHRVQKCSYLPELESFGYAYPNVRKSTWSLLQSLLKAWKGSLEPLLPILSTSVLRSAWIEPDPNVHSVMWSPLLSFLKEYPTAWEMDRTSAWNDGDKNNGDDEAEGDGDDDDDEEDETGEGKVQPATTKYTPSIAYEEFLSFLELGCSGSPLQGYPTVVITLSTIPTNILIYPTSGSLPLDALSRFTASFWAAVDGRALTGLHRSQTSAAFLSSLLECVVFIVRRLYAALQHQNQKQDPPSEVGKDQNPLPQPPLPPPEEGKDKAPPQPTTLVPEAASTGDAVAFMKEQISRVWYELLSAGGLKMEPRAAARIVGHTLSTLSSSGNNGFFDAAWDSLSNDIKSSALSVPAASAAALQANVEHETVLISAFLKGFSDQFKDGHGKSRADALESEVLAGSVERLKAILERTQDLEIESEGKEADDKMLLKELSMLKHLLEQFRSALFRNATFTSAFDSLVERHVFRFLDQSVQSQSLLLAYFAHRKDVQTCQRLWQAILLGIGQRYRSGSEALWREARDAVGVLIGGMNRPGSPAAAAGNSLPRDLHPESDVLDDVVLELLRKALEGGSADNDDGFGGAAMEVVKQVVKHSDFFLTQNGVDSIVQQVYAAFVTSVEVLLYPVDAETKMALSRGLRRLVELLEFVIDKATAPTGSERESSASFLVHLFLLAYLLPQFNRVDEGIYTSAQLAWEQWVSSGANARTAAWRELVGDAVKSRLGEMVRDVKAEAMPEHILALVNSQPRGVSIDVVGDLLPAPNELSKWTGELPAYGADPSLMVVDQLIPSPSSSSSSSSSPSSSPSPLQYDKRGLSSYARTFYLLLLTLSEDRQVARRNIWAVRYFAALEVYADDWLRVASADVKGGIFSRRRGVGGRELKGKAKVKGESGGAAGEDPGLGLLDAEGAEWESERERERLVGSVSAKARQIITYVLKSGSGGVEAEQRTRQGLSQSWSSVAVDAALASWDKKPLPAAAAGNEKVELLLTLVDAAAKAGGEGDRTRDSRVLRNVLQRVLDDVDKSEAEKWITLAKKAEKTAPETSIAILLAVTHSAPEPPNLDRFRNELAASLLSIPPRDANTRGLLALRKLAASAPDQDKEVGFLVQNRALNVVKVCQKWVSEAGDAGGGGKDQGGEEEQEEEEEEEGVSEDVESAMALVLWHLVPILQNVPGSHWEFIFDVVESTLEAADIMNDMALAPLARSLKLIIAIQEVAATNKVLKAEWSKREVPVLKMVRDLASVRINNAGVSLPRSVCRELILKIVKDLPKNLVDQETLPKMVHLIMDTSFEVQKMAYKLLSGAARKRTEYYVIEAAVEIESQVKAELPNELLGIVQHIIPVAAGDEASDEHERVEFGYLLAWMLVFDSFQDASLKIRASYIDQLRSLDLLSSYFFPNLLAILRLDEGLVKGFKLDLWDVEEFFVELFEPRSGFAIQVLSAHLYYRALLALPSLINTWVLDCRDRQLFSTIMNYTAQYFAPVIIKAELSDVRESAAASGGARDSGDALVDGNFTVKVIPTANEVVASYLVDDHHLEIKLKIPSDWPLHKIEVKDLKRVGVEENLWRAWLLAVQQTIWSHNGRIVDGLSLFKKNVTLHFEGQVECAICYSIISTMDGSLPKKPCKTCKNRFHAGCLYKWFESSHSSSCPLCRSDIM